MRISVLPVIALLFTGCAFSPASMMSGYFEKVKDAIAGQDDPELVKQGVPTLILLIDAALAEDPDNSQLLLTASTIYTTYAQAFVTGDKDEARAAVLYGRAKDYALKLLEKNATFKAAVDSSCDEFEQSLSAFDKDDVPDLYAAGTAWLGWILSKPDSMEALIQLPKPLAIMRRVLELDETYADGGVHTIFGIYYAVRPPGAGRDLEKSRYHFQRAIELSKGENLLTQVAFAEFYLTASENAELFDKTLHTILEHEADRDENRRYALINAIARERAAKLLKRKDNYF